MAQRAHAIHDYDVGIGGDGLRGPATGFDNSHRKFLARDAAPEVWSARQLVSGGKHDGHFEVNVGLGAQGHWQVNLVPVPVFPVINTVLEVIAWERRTDDDHVTISMPLSR